MLRLQLCPSKQSSDTYTDRNNQLYTSHPSLSVPYCFSCFVAVLAYLGSLAVPLSINFETIVLILDLASLDLGSADIGASTSTQGNIVHRTVNRLSDTLIGYQP